MSSVAALGLVAGCRERPKSAGVDDAKSAAPAIASSVTGAGPSAAGSASAPSAEPAPAEIETWALEQPPALRGIQGLFPIENAVLVTSGLRVGRLVDPGKIDWLGQIPDGGMVNDPNQITGLAGRHPDEIGVRYQRVRGRIAEPTYAPLTGKGRTLVEGEGGMRADLFGMVSVGASTVVGTATPLGGLSLVTVRGPARRFVFQTGKQAGCAGPVNGGSYGTQGFAIEPLALAGTPSGDLFSVGHRCGDGPLAIERWDEAGAGKSTLLEVPWESPAAGSGASFPQFLQTKDGPLYLYRRFREGLFAYKNGQFVEVAKLPKETAFVFLSAASPSELWALGPEGVAVRRGEASTFTSVARFRFRTSFQSAARTESGTWASIEQGPVVQLVKTVSESPTPGCATPFVYLYDVSPKNDAKYTFPTTQKALAAFPERESLTLVEAVIDGRRRLGVRSQTMARGEALLTYLQQAEAMKKERPRLLCLDVPEGRVIPGPRVAPTK
jgi:hypothetical protein